MNKILSVSLLLFSVSSVLRAEEWGFSYSGRLMEVRDGVRHVALGNQGETNYYASFYVRLYDEADETSASTNVLWGRLIAEVPVKNGNFAFELRDSAGSRLPDAKWTSLQDAFAHLSGDRMTIGVRPFSDTESSEILPRQQFVSAPFAALAGDALGSFGDLRFGGTLTTAGMAVPSAEFRKDVTHDGAVTFLRSPAIPALALKEGTSFRASAVVTTNAMKTGSLSAANLIARNATVTLTDARALFVTNLSVAGGVNTPLLTAKDGTGLTVAGDVSGVQALKVAKIELDGSANLFDFTPNEVKRVAKAITGSETWMWNNNSWTAPYVGKKVHNYFVSLSLRISPSANPMATSASSVKVYVGGQQVSELAISGVSGETWLPFSTFMKSGEIIRWEGGSGWSDDTVLLTCREARY